MPKAKTPKAKTQRRPRAKKPRKEVYAYMRTEDESILPEMRRAFRKAVRRYSPSNTRTIRQDGTISLVATFWGDAKGRAPDGIFAVLGNALDGCENRDAISGLGCTNDAEEAGLTPDP